MTSERDTPNLAFISMVHYILSVNKVSTLYTQSNMLDMENTMIAWSLDGA